MLWLLLVMGNATAFSVNYPKVFGSDWTDAERYVIERHEAWKKEFDVFGVDARLAEAVVFPELIRYSFWKDEIEKVAVNGLYVKKGRDGADFSVGRFQMKPSFAEKVERTWNSSPLAQEYGFSFNIADNVEARRSRVLRLGTEEGQCRYLAIFIRLQELRLPQLAKVSRKQKVRLLATAYNRSFSASWLSLCQIQYERLSIPMLSRPEAHNCTAMLTSLRVFFSKCSNPNTNLAEALCLSYFSELYTLTEP